MEETHLYWEVLVGRRPWDIFLPGVFLHTEAATVLSGPVVEDGKGLTVLAAGGATRLLLCTSASTFWLFTQRNFELLELGLLV